jgi:NDP-sugar pyrophosphorylase family protein
MQIVVLAGGPGTRLKPLTEETPKSMIPVKGKPFLYYQIELFKRNDIRDIVLCVGYMAEKIMERFGDGSKFGVRIRYSVEGGTLLGTAGALKKAEPLLDDVFFLTYGDAYLVLDYTNVMAYFKRSDKLGLMVVYKNSNRFDKSNVVIEDGYVKVYDKKRQTAEMAYIDYGVSVLSNKSLSLIAPNVIMDLQEFYRALIERRELLAYETYNRFYEIGSFTGLKEFRQLNSIGVLATSDTKYGGLS